MATYLELQDRVTRNVIDIPDAISTGVPQLINSAMRTLQKQHNFKVMETLLTATSAVDTRVLVAVPSDWKEPRGDAWMVEDNRGFKRAIPWASSRESFVGGIDDEDDGRPQFLLESEPTDTGARNIELWPLSDSNSDYSGGEYRLVIPYWRFLPALSVDGSTNWFTVNADQYIEYEATQQAFALDWDEDRMAVWAQKAAIEKKDVINTDKKFRLAGVRTLVPHYHGARTPMLRI